MLTVVEKIADSDPTLRHWAEYLLVRTLLVPLTWLPRQAARSLGAAIASGIARIGTGLTRTGNRNLELAFPGIAPAERDGLLSRMYRNLGWHLAEFAQMRRYSPDFARASVFRYEGLEHYTAAAAKGSGVLVLTGHLGAWELSSFVHSLVGFPMGMVARKLDNPLIDRFVNRIRCMHGNRILHKDDFARGLLRAMQQGETVGILMDTNMTPPQGIFVPFFGKAACTAAGLARVARKTGAVVLPGFLLWSEAEERYVLTFGEALQIVRTEDAEADAVTNTTLFAQVTEAYVRQFPDQWLWLHRRWKTRPAGEEPVYASRAVAQSPVAAIRTEAN